jgi:hypothetical protein
MKHRLTSLVAFFNCDAPQRPRLAVNEPVAFRNTHADIAVDDDCNDGRSDMLEMRRPMRQDPP